MAAGAEQGSEWVVEVEHLAKIYRIYNSDRGRVAELLLGGQRHQEVYALKDISFRVGKGSAFGVIGPNAAGKSTLLKVLSGISPPTSGRIDIKASLNCLLDLGLGFHGDFTGRQNSVLSCRLLGMTNDEIAERVPAILEFAEIGGFGDMPVRTYSTGMTLRLAFSISAHLGHEILLIDELLSVGDVYFQRKCIRRIEEFIAEGRTLILVSHDLHAVREMCDHAIWLDGGEVQAHGEARHVVEAYVDQARATVMSRIQPPRPAMVEPEMPETEEREKGEPLLYRATTDDPQLEEMVRRSTRLPGAESWRTTAGARKVEIGDADHKVAEGSGEVEILRVRLLDGDGDEVDQRTTFDPLTVAVTFRTLEPIQDPILGVAIFRNDEVYVFGPNTRFSGVEEMQGTYDGVYTYFIHYPRLPLLEGSYRLSVAVYDKGHVKPHIWHNQLYELKVTSPMEDHGLVHVDHHWGLVIHARGDREDLP